MLRATHGHLASKNENKRQKNIGRWFEVMTAGTTDKVALYWYAEPSVLTHMRWCGDYTHTHTHAHELHARNTHTNTCTHARMQHSHVHTSHARTQHSHAHTHTHTHMDGHTSTPHDQHTLSRSSAQPTCACAHIRPWQTHTQPGDSRTWGGVLSRLRKFLFIWPFPHAN